MRSVPPLVLFLVCVGVSAQSTNPKVTPPAGPAADPYAAEPGVIVRLDVVTEMHADGTGSKRRSGVIRVQSEAMLKQLGVLSVPFASGSQTVEFKYARVRHPDGSVVETPASDAIEQPEPVTRQAPFYSDLKDAQLPVKGLRVGDTLEWECLITQFKAEAPGQFWGQEAFITDGITLQENYELRVPSSVHVHVWTNPRSGASTSETTSGDTHIFRWTHQNLKLTVGPSADAAREAEKKRVLTAPEELDVKEGKLPDFAWTTFPSWEAVGTWYHGLEADRSTPSAAVKAKVAEVTANKTGEEDRVRAVYAYVSTQIHYIGVAFGIGRYQPHTADEILNSQYGDCKDKHTLLAAMLQSLGLQPDAVLIGAGIRFNEAVPAPQSFNHLITRVKVDGKEVWLDSTAEVAPYRMLAAALRDKPGLVIPPQGPAAIVRTPLDPPFPFVNSMSAKGTLDKDGLSNSHIALSYRGDTELFLREVAQQITPAQYDELTQKLVGSMGYAGTTSHSEVARPDDTSQPFTISFDYRREKSGDWDNQRILPQLAPVMLPIVDAKDPPRQALQLLAPRTEVSHAEMQLPPGWGAELPEAVHETSPYATYDLTYHLEKGVLITDRRVTILRESVPVSDWKQYKTWQDAVGLGNENYVQLTPPGAGKPAEARSGDSSSSASATTLGAELIEQADIELRNHQLEAAQTTLDRAKAIHAEVRGLWNGYGYLEFLRGETENAIRDYRKELDLHPGEAWTYRQLAGLQIATNKHAEAAETFQSWMAAAPHDPDPVVGLVNLLLTEGRPKEAVEAAKSGLAHLGPDVNGIESVQLALGEAQIKTGATADAEATLNPLLKSTSANSLNTAAYDLADASLELQAAEDAERAALKKLEVETSAWTLHESPATLAQTSALLAASWDTMGWILFREGNSADAERYLQAARRSLRDWVVSEHLGEVEAARGNRAAALAAYEEADALLSKVDAMGIHKDPGPEATELERKIGTLKQAGVKPGPWPDLTSQAARTFGLGPARGRSGTAEYRLLLSREKVEDIEPIGNKELSDAAKLLGSFKTADYFPPTSEGRLVKTGFLNCHGAVCEFVLRP